MQGVFMQVTRICNNVTVFDILSIYGDTETRRNN